jgi:hypothetical protein
MLCLNSVGYLARLPVCQSYSASPTWICQFASPYPPSQVVSLYLLSNKLFSILYLREALLDHVVFSVLVACNNLEIVAQSICLYTKFIIIDTKRGENNKNKEDNLIKVAVSNHS